MERKDILSFLWDEYQLRQQHYWSTFNRFGLAIVTINIVPYVKPDILAPLGSLALVFPFTSLVLSIVSTWLLGAEYQRLRMVRQKYDELLGEDGKIPRMPLKTWRDRRVATPIGSLIAIMFGLGFTAFSLLNAVVLWLYFIHVPPKSC